MLANELRERYQRFFEQRGHSRIPSAPLLPENDPTVLFTTAGMQPLAPFLLGERHPMGRRLVNVQRCLRTGDIEQVGDESHLTFFEMLGNWSLGDYFKQESLGWSFEFLTQELGLDAGRLAATVFAGDADAPRDEESAAIWRSLGLPPERIYYLPKEDNWWGPVGESGPCGPDSEIFYDTGRPDHPGCRPGCACGKWFEVWNNVFMVYNRTPDGRYEPLRQRNVDTGMGLDRTVAVLQGTDDVFQIETVWPLIEKLEQLSGKPYAEHKKSFRIIADHLRAASMAIADGARPSNVEAGYVVRRLIRRALRHGYELGIPEGFSAPLGQLALAIFAPVYSEVSAQQQRVCEELEREETRFKGALERGLKRYHKVAQAARDRGDPSISGEEAFNLFETYGFPLPFTAELAQEEGLQVDVERFEQLLEEHRQVSRRGLEQKFKGGLADHSVQATRLHTATHLLHEALRRVLGPHVRQMGSNISAERLRFDFFHHTKLSEEQLSQAEQMVNEQIEQDLPVEYELMSLDEALASGALAFFGEKYGERVKVYRIGEFSREVCGGPHVKRSGELGRFRIVKEEVVGQGVRRVRGVLEER